MQTTEGGREGGREGRGEEEVGKGVQKVGLYPMHEVEHPLSGSARLLAVQCLCRAGENNQKQCVCICKCKCKCVHEHANPSMLV